MDQKQLLNMISQGCDGILSEEEFAQLENELTQNQASRQLYYECMDIHSTISGNAVAEETLAKSFSLKQSLTPQPHQPKDTSPRWIHTGMVGLAATLLVGISLLALRDAVTLVPRDNPLAANQPSISKPLTNSIVRVQSLSPDSQWSIDSLAQQNNQQLPFNETLRVHSGAVALDYQSGTRVVLLGPALYNAASELQARLLAGKMTANVAKGDEGFSVSTARATIVDLGTYFGLNVTSNGATDVLVFEGEVDINNCSAKPEEEAQRLTMGEAIRLNVNGTTSRIVSISSDSYTPHQPSPLRTEQNEIITAVSDNVSLEDSFSFYEIVRQGMREDAIAFVDRVAHQYNGIDKRGLPPYLVGGDYVKTFNNRKHMSDIRIDVELATPANLYILLDRRIDPPNWLVEQFEEMKETIGLDVGPFMNIERTHWHNQVPSGVGPGESIDDVFTVWRKQCHAAGVVHLGGQQPPAPSHESSSGYNMYGIVATPLEML